MVTSRYEHKRNVGHLQTGNKTFEIVQSFQYLGNNISTTTTTTTTTTTNNNNNNDNYYYYCYKCIKES
jgi:hypothetical protein